MHSNSQLVVSCHLRFQLFITFERYCTAKSAKVKLREKHRNSLHFRGCQKQFVYFYFQGGFRLRFVGVFVIFCYIFCYLLFLLSTFFLYRAWTLTQRKRWGFNCKPWMFLSFLPRSVRNFPTSWSNCFVKFANSWQGHRNSAWRQLMRACYSPSPRGRWTTTSWNTITCEQALRGALAAGREKELHLWNLNSASNSPVAPRRLSG